MPRRLLLPALLLLVLAAFAPCFRAGFTLWDDQETVAYNPELAPVTASSFRHFWTRAYADLYAPVTYSVWGALAPLARLEQPGPTGSMLDPAVYHACNVLLHCASTILVFLICRRLVGPDVPALAGAALFALHPLQVEPVAWVSGTKDVLAGMLALAALLLYLRAAFDNAEQVEPETLRKPLPFSPPYFAATVLFALSMLAKPSTVTLPLIAAVLDWLALGRPARRILLSVTPWLVLAIPIIVIGRIAQPAHVVAYVPPFYARPMVAADAVGFYLGQLLLPVRFGIDYGRTPARVLASAELFLTLPLVLLAAWVTWRLRRHPLVPAAALVFVLALLPVLGLVPFDFQQYSTVADHYAYLAMLGPAVLATWALATFRPKRPGRVLAGACVAVVLLAGGTFAQAMVWTDSVSLFRHATVVNPGSVTGHLNAAISLVQAGEPAEGAREFEQTLRLDPHNAKAHLGLGRLYALANQPGPAMQHFRAAVAADPLNAQAHFNLAVLLASIDQTDEAIDELREAVALAPAYAEAHANLAGLLAARGDVSGAIRHYETALRLRPDLAAARQALEQLRSMPPATTQAAPRP